jgi:hypothetical protein
MKHVPNLISHEPMMETARINDYEDLKYAVLVNGGPSDAPGEKEYGEPHFHFSDKRINSNWEFSVLIPSVDEWKQSKELYIIESKTGDFTWSGFRKQKKQLVEWLDKKCPKTNNVFTNLEYIRMEWNTLNSDNKNVNQIAKISDIGLS